MSIIFFISVFVLITPMASLNKLVMCTFFKMSIKYIFIIVHKKYMIEVGKIISGVEVKEY